MCSCGRRFDIEHSVSCKKGGFVTIRYTDFRDLTAKILSKLYSDMELNQTLHRKSGEDFNNRTTNRSNKAVVLEEKSTGFTLDCRLLKQSLLCLHGL